MLALTQTAAEAVEAVLAAPGVPDHAGVRISADPAPTDGQGPTGVGFRAAIAEAPAETDTVLEARDARVFVEESIVPILDDQVLDADTDGDAVRFMITPQPG